MSPVSVALGPDGKYYVSNLGANRGTRMDGSMKIISGTPFDGTATVSDLATGLRNPTGIFFVGSDLFVADDDRVWKISTTGEAAGEKSVYLAPDAFPGGTELLNDIIADADGTFFISDSDRGVIFKADPQGRVSLFLEGDPMKPLRRPYGLLFDTDGHISGRAGALLVIDSGNGNLAAVSPADGSTELIATGFGNGIGLALDAQGNLYVSDFLGGLGQIRRLKLDRTIEVVTRTLSPADIIVEKERGWLIVPNLATGRVTFFELQ
jgi:sugar lactone lactonase YvrE